MPDGALRHDPGCLGLSGLGQEVNLKGIGVPLVLGCAVLMLVDILKRDMLSFQFDEVIFISHFPRVFRILCLWEPEREQRPLCRLADKSAHIPTPRDPAASRMDTEIANCHYYIVKFLVAATTLVESNSSFFLIKVQKKANKHDSICTALCRRK